MFHRRRRRCHSRRFLLAVVVGVLLVITCRNVCTVEAQVRSRHAASTGASRTPSEQSSSSSTTSAAARRKTATASETRRTTFHEYSNYNTNNNPQKRGGISTRVLVTSSYTSCVVAGIPCTCDNLYYAQDEQTAALQNEADAVEEQTGLQGFLGQAGRVGSALGTADAVLQLGGLSAGLASLPAMISGLSAGAAASGGAAGVLASAAAGIAFVVQAAAVVLAVVAVVGLLILVYKAVVEPITETISKLATGKAMEATQEQKRSAWWTAEITAIQRDLSRTGTTCKSRLLQSSRRRRRSPRSLLFNQLSNLGMADLALPNFLRLQQIGTELVKAEERITTSAKPQTTILNSIIESVGYNYCCKNPDARLVISDFFSDVAAVSKCFLTVSVEEVTTTLGDTMMGMTGLLNFVTAVKAIDWASQDLSFLRKIRMRMNNSTGVLLEKIKQREISVPDILGSSSSNVNSAVKTATKQLTKTNETMDETFFQKVKSRCGALAGDVFDTSDAITCKDFLKLSDGSLGTPCCSISDCNTTDTDIFTCGYNVCSAGKTNDVCWQDDQCRDGFCVANYAGIATKRCSTGTAGEFCLSGSDCEYMCDLFDDPIPGGTCTSGKMGAKCEESKHCAAHNSTTPLVCANDDWVTTGQCSVVKDVGASCNYDNECSSQNCNSYTNGCGGGGCVCIQPKGTGQNNNPCASNEDCANGKCASTVAGCPTGGCVCTNGNKGDKCVAGRNQCASGLGCNLANYKCCRTTWIGIPTFDC